MSVVVSRIGGSTSNVSSTYLASTLHVTVASGPSGSIALSALSNAPLTLSIHRCHHSFGYRVASTAQVLRRVERDVTPRVGVRSIGTRVGEVSLTEAEVADLCKTTRAAIARSL